MALINPGHQALPITQFKEDQQNIVPFSQSLSVCSYKLEKKCSFVCRPKHLLVGATTVFAIIRKWLSTVYTRVFLLKHAMDYM